MPRLFGGLTALGILAALSTSAAADDWADCMLSRTDPRIAACTRIIDKGGESQQSLALAYTYRGHAYRFKGDKDGALADYSKALDLDPTRAAYVRGHIFLLQGERERAIAQFDEAIRLDPSYAIAYNSRGNNIADSNPDRAIADYSKAIELDPKYALAYRNRGNAYRSKREFEQALADYNRVIELDPKSTSTYDSRGDIYRLKGDHDRAIADYNKAIELDPKSAPAYDHRGYTYHLKGDHDHAIADFNKAIELDPKATYSYNNRALIYARNGDHDRAIADYNKAIELDAKFGAAYLNRGNVYEKKGDYDLAIADYDKVIELDPKVGLAYLNQGNAYERKGDNDRALANYRQILELPVVSPTDRQRQEIVRQRIARLTQPQRAVSPPLQRVALVIGNSQYTQVGLLTNPKNDARAMAAMLRRLGFAEVAEHYDLSREKMGQAIKEFGDRAEGAEWALVFFAGHGIEMNGVTYLIPTDAALKRDAHVSDETISLTQVQAKVDAATKLGLIILDSCRNNPFLERMIRSTGATRSVGRGLANIEPEGNVLVAYSAKHGTTALDGSGPNSPFTEALLAYIEEPGLEINFLFRKVRDVVRAKTQRRQEPFVYGSLSSELLYFKAAR